jgi:hypothetical protein
MKKGSVSEAGESAKTKVESSRESVAVMTATLCFMASINEEFRVVVIVDGGEDLR